MAGRVGGGRGVSKVCGRKGGGGGRRGGQEWSGIPILVPAVLRLEYSRLLRLLLIGWLPAWLFPSGLALGITGIPSLV